MCVIPEKETLTVEFKSDRKKLHDNALIEAVVGMTNADGGTIYLGVEDDGTPTGLHPEHLKIEGIIGLVASRTSPPLVVKVQAQTVNEKQVALIEVPKSHQIVAHTSGKVLQRRIGHDGQPEVVPFLPHEHNRRLSALGTHDASRQPIAGATLDDFDPAERIRLRQFVEQNQGDTALLSLEDNELHRALGLVTNENGKDVPTLLGLLLIGKEDALRRLVPAHEVAFQVMDGENVKVNLFKRSPLLKIVEWLDTTFAPLNSEEELQMGLFRLRVPKVDTAAFREAVANALTHRDYSILGAIHIRLEKDTMSISSPGGFVEGVTLNNLLTTEPRPRNPALADAFKRAGLVERTGRGVDLIYRGLLRYGRPKPDYSRSNSTTVVLRMPISDVDMAFMKMIVEVENKTRTALPVDSLIALSLLREQRRINRNDLALAIQKDEDTATRVLEQLNEKGLIQSHGKTRGRTYTLAPSMYAAMGEKSEYVHQAGFELIQQQNMVAQFLQAHEKIKREDVMNLCRLNGNEASRLLKQMADAGDIIRHGSKRWTYYTAATSKTDL